MREAIEQTDTPDLSFEEVGGVFICIVYAAFPQQLAPNVSYAASGKTYTTTSVEVK